MGVIRFNFELYLLKECPLSVPTNTFSASCYYTLTMKNSKSTGSTIQISYISKRLDTVERILPLTGVSFA